MNITVRGTITIHKDLDVEDIVRDVIEQNLTDYFEELSDLDDFDLDSLEIDA